MRNMTDEEFMDLIDGLSDEISKQKEINSKLVQAIKWLTGQVANNNTWIGKLNGEIKDHEAMEENNESFWDDLEKILPKDLLK